MKKKLFFLGTTLFTISVFLAIKPTPIKATCYYTNNAGYDTCSGDPKNLKCPQDLFSTKYACCNNVDDTCPPPLDSYTNPNQTPIPKDPKSDPNCGGTGQDCCSGNTCDTLSLTCYLAKGGGYKCLDQSQINAVEGYFPTNTPLPVTCGSNNTGIKTAIGCIPVLGSTDDFLAAILKWAVGIGGGIAFVLMLYAGFMLMTAQGNPERMKAGQELMTSAVAGLILLIFSIFILKFIGVDILGLQKFGFGQ